MSATYGLAVILPSFSTGTHLQSRNLAVIYPTLSGNKASLAGKVTTLFTTLTPE